MKLDLVEVAGLLLRQQGGMVVLPGIHLVHKEGRGPSTFIVLGTEQCPRSSGQGQGPLAVETCWSYTVI